MPVKIWLTSERARINAMSRRVQCRAGEMVPSWSDSRSSFMVRLKVIAAHERAKRLTVFVGATEGGRHSADDQLSDNHISIREFLGAKEADWQVRVADEGSQHPAH